MFEKFAEDVTRRYQEKMAVLSSIPFIRNAFRTAKGISDKYVGKNERMGFRDNGYHMVAYDKNLANKLRSKGIEPNIYTENKRALRNEFDKYVGFANENPALNSIINKVNKDLPSASGSDSDRYAADLVGGLSRRRNKKPTAHLGSSFLEDALKQGLTQEDIEKYLDARNILSTYFTTYKNLPF